MEKAVGLHHERNLFKLGDKQGYRISKVTGARLANMRISPRCCRAFWGHKQRPEKTPEAMKSRKFLPITGQGAQGRDVHSTEQVYAFICDYIGQNNFAPSVRDIAQGCYLSVSAVLRHLDRLEAWGHITGGRRHSLRSGRVGGRKGQRFGAPYR